MMKHGECPECGGREIIADVPVTATGYHNPLAPGVSVVVDEPPVTVLGVPIWQGDRSSPLRAWICGACGYTALFVPNPRELLDIAQHQHPR